MTLIEEFKSRNFSIYGQWTGVLCIILCFAIGITKCFSSHIIFAIICVITGALIIFIEIPLLLRICPTSPKFDEFMRRFTTNYMRAAYYSIGSVLQWISIVQGPSVLIVPAFFLGLTAIFYAIAGVRGHDFAGSKTLGGQGLAQMIV